MFQHAVVIVGLFFDTLSNLPVFSEPVCLIVFLSLALRHPCSLFLVSNLIFCIDFNCCSVVQDNHVYASFDDNCCQFSVINLVNWTTCLLPEELGVYKLLVVVLLMVLSS